MRWFLNLPVLNNDDRHSTKQENIRPALEVCIRTATGHKHTETWGVMHREMKYSAGFLVEGSQSVTVLSLQPEDLHWQLPTTAILTHIYSPFAWGTLCVFITVHSDCPDVEVSPFQPLGKPKNHQYFRESVFLPLVSFFIQKSCGLYGRWAGIKGLEKVSRVHKALRIPTIYLPAVS